MAMEHVSACQIRTRDLCTDPPASGSGLCFEVSGQFSFSDGDEAFEANGRWAGIIDVPAATTVTLDLRALENSCNGDIVNLAIVKQLLLINQNKLTGQALLVGSNNGPNDWLAPFNGVNNSKIRLGPKGMLFLSEPDQGWPTTGYHLHLINSSGTTITVHGMATGVRA